MSIRSGWSARTICQILILARFAPSFPSRWKNWWLVLASQACIVQLAELACWPALVGIDDVRTLRTLIPRCRIPRRSGRDRGIPAEPLAIQALWRSRSALVGACLPTLGAFREELSERMTLSPHRFLSAY